MLLAAAFVSYAGPFTSKFRAGLIKEWIKFLMDKGAPMTPGISDPLKVGSTSNSMTAASQASLLLALLVAMSQNHVNDDGADHSVSSRSYIGIPSVKLSNRTAWFGPAGAGG